MHAIQPVLRKRRRHHPRRHPLPKTHHIVARPRSQLAHRRNPAPADRPAHRTPPASPHPHAATTHRTTDRPPSPYAGCATAAQSPARHLYLRAQPQPQPPATGLSPWPSPTLPPPRPAHAPAARAQWPPYATWPLRLPPKSRQTSSPQAQPGPHPPAPVSSTRSCHHHPRNRGRHKKPGAPSQTAPPSEVGRYKSPGAPSIAPLRWVGRKPLTPLPTHAITGCATSTSFFDLTPANFPTGPKPRHSRPPPRPPHESYCATAPQTSSPAASTREVARRSKPSHAHASGPTAAAAYPRSHQTPPADPAHSATR